jgi:hypothetical protein
MLTRVLPGGRVAMRGVANGGCRKETQKSQEETQDDEGLIILDHDACRDEHPIEVSIEVCHAIVSVRRQSNSSSRHPRARSLGIPFPRSGAPPSVCEAFTSFSLSS